jgi:hypothetical protein
MKSEDDGEEEVDDLEEPATADQTGYHQPWVITE